MTNVKLPGPNLWLSIMLLALGLILASVGGWQSFRGAFDLLFVESSIVPGTEVRELTEGEYDIYGQAPLTFDVDDVTVEHTATGESVALRTASDDVTLDRNVHQYHRVARFDIDDAGEYEISIQGVTQSRSVVGLSIESSFDRISGWLITFGIGALMAFVGVIMLFVGIIRRSRHKRHAAQTGAPAGYVTPSASQPPLPGQPPAPAGTATMPPPLAPTSPPGAGPSHLPAASPQDSRPTESDTPW